MDKAQYGYPPTSPVPANRPQTAADKDDAMEDGEGAKPKTGGSRKRFENLGLELCPQLRR